MGAVWARVRDRVRATGRVTVLVQIFMTCQIGGVRGFGVPFMRIDRFWGWASGVRLMAERSEVLTLPHYTH